MGPPPTGDLLLPENRQPEIGSNEATMDALGDDLWDHSFLGENATDAIGRLLAVHGNHHLDAQAACARNAYAELAARGLCIRRGCGAPKWGHHTRCRAHHEELLAYFRRKRAKAKGDKP